MSVRRITASLLCIVLLLALTGCGKAEYEFSFDENGIGKALITTYISEEAFLAMLQPEGDEPAEPVVIDYEKEGLVPVEIDGEKYVSSGKEFRFRTSGELKQALQTPVTDDENDPLSIVKNDLGDDAGKLSYSMFNRDGYRFFRIVFDASSPEVQDADSYDSEESPEEILEGIESYRALIQGDSTKITLRAVMGVEVEGSCSTADVSKGHASLDFYEEIRAWLDRAEAAIKEGREFTEPEPGGFVMTGNIGRITSLPFTDVADGTWYKDPVFNAYGKGLIEGTAYDRFSPDTGLTHAQAITLACRLRSIWEKDKDVLKDGDEIWYQPYLDYAKAKGITDDRFDEKMNEQVTRAEMAFYFSRALPKELYKTDAVENLLTDVAASEYFENIDTLAKSGIVDGYADKSFKPDQYIKRCEAASILSKIADML
jgi:hypothetical protein